MNKNILESWLFKTPIAHRGLHNEQFPENSLPAFENAIKHNFPIELDVRTIDDGTVIVFHDDTIGRMTGVDGYSSNLKLDDLTSLKLSNTDSVIPTFEQTLELVNGKVPLLIETKNANSVGLLEKTVNEMLKSYKGDFALQSFNPYSMEYFKIHSPDFLRGQLSCIFGKNDLPFIKRYLLSRLKLLKVASPHFVSYCFSDLPNKFVTKADLPTLAWTVNSMSDYEKVIDYCDNIIFEKFIPETIL